MSRPWLPLLAISLISSSPLAAQSIFGTNLIVNGGAEAGAGSGSSTLITNIPGWTSKGANVITYASGYGIETGDIVPIGAGKNYFSNGSTSSSLTQSISLAAAASAIDNGVASFDASGYFGGYANYDDSAAMTSRFSTRSGTSLSVHHHRRREIGGSRFNGMYLRRQIGAVPVGTRSATVTVNFTITPAARTTPARTIFR